MSKQTITVEQLGERLREQEGGVEILDVRTPVEFREVHAVGARNVPLNRLNPAEVLSDRNGGAAEPLYVMCKGGVRSTRAQQQFLDAGFDNVVNVEGGTDAWVAAGLPVVREANVMSLERQVRIAAGLISLVGALLAIFIHPYFAGVPAFIGAGLVFAGVTGWCGMGMLLARMPEPAMNWQLKPGDPAEDRSF